MKLKEGLTLRKLGGVAMVAPTGAAAKTFHGVIRLNETGAFLWGKLSQEQTAETLTAALLDEYDVTPEQAHTDVAAFLRQVREADLLV